MSSQRGSIVVGLAVGLAVGLIVGGGGVALLGQGGTEPKKIVSTVLITSVPTATSASISASTPSHVPPQVTIDNLKDGDSVSAQEQPVKGTAHGVPLGQELWLLNRPMNNPKYHPQGDDGIVASQDGSWQVMANIGDPGKDAGKSFTLYVVTVPKDTGNKIRDYLSRARIDSTWTGLDKLFDDQSVHAQVRVVRK